LKSRAQLNPQKITIRVWFYTEIGA